MKSKLLTALLCLIVSFGLWMYVITVVSPGSENTFTDIPVEIKNINTLTERDLMILGDTTPTVTLRLAGNRSDLLKLNSQNITVQVDASKIIEAGLAELSYTVSYPGNVPNNALTIQSRNPDYIVLEVVDRAEKPIPVEIIANKESVPPNYIPDEPTSEVKQIKISGPADRIALIEKAVINIDLTGRTESIHENFTYTLCDRDGNPVDAKYVETDTQQVFVDLLIQRYKIIPLRVNIIPGGGATEKDVTVSFSPDEIMVYGSEAALEKLEYLEVGTLDLSLFTGDQSITFPITLPEGITHATGEGARVTVDLSFGDLVTNKLTVTNIVLQNVPEGMVAKNYTDFLEVTVRGPKELMAMMDTSYLTAVADLTNVTPGTHKWPVTILIDKKFPVVGVIGSYQIAVAVSEAAEGQS